MFTSQILKLYHDYDYIKTNSKRKAHEKELNELIRCDDAMQKRIGDDKELEKLFKDFERALNLLHYVEEEDIFKDAFILGARVTLEICGVECEED